MRVNGHDGVDGIVDVVTSLRRAVLEILRLDADLEQRIATRTRQLQEANEALHAGIQQAKARLPAALSPAVSGAPPG